MRISDHIDPQLVIVGLRPAPKPELLAHLVDRVLAAGITLPREETLRRLMAREREASTGLAHGVAIPHTVVDGLDRTVVAVATLPGGTDFQALDGAPTRVLFLILNPTQKMGAHIRLLARLAGLAYQDQVIAGIAQAADPQLILDAIRADDDRHLGAP